MQNINESQKQTRSALENALNAIQDAIAQRKLEGNTPIEQFSCELCKDTGYVFNNNIKSMCNCKKIKQLKALHERSGVAKAFKTKTFDEFNDVDSSARIAKQTALEYIQNFEKLKDDRNNSIAFLGQVGSGKTHLAIATLNRLIYNQIPVLYVNYLSILPRLKMLAMDEVNYYKQLKTLVNVPVLLVDDIFKECTNADIKHVYNIVNERYMHNKPMIITSEKSMPQLIAIDEAVGSRIYEMCKNYTITLKSKNYRLREE